MKKGTLLETVQIFENDGNDLMYEYDITGCFPTRGRTRTAYCWGAVAAYRGKSRSENPYEDTGNWGHTWFGKWDDGYSDYKLGRLFIDEWIIHKAADQTKLASGENGPCFRA